MSADSRTQFKGETNGTFQFTLFPSASVQYLVVGISSVWS